MRQSDIFIRAVKGSETKYLFWIHTEELNYSNMMIVIFWYNISSELHSFIYHHKLLPYFILKWDVV